MRIRLALRRRLQVLSAAHLEVQASRLRRDREARWQDPDIRTTLQVRRPQTAQSQRRLP